MLLLTRNILVVLKQVNIKHSFEVIIDSGGIFSIYILTTRTKIVNTLTYIS